MYWKQKKEGEELVPKVLEMPKGDARSPQEWLKKGLWRDRLEEFAKAVFVECGSWLTIQEEETIKNDSRSRNWVLRRWWYQGWMGGREGEVSFCRGIDELFFRQNELETSIWKCPAGNIKLVLRQMVIARDVDLGILWSVEYWMKVFSFKIINNSPRLSLGLQSYFV